MSSIAGCRAGGVALELTLTVRALTRNGSSPTVSRAQFGQGETSEPRVKVQGGTDMWDSTVNARRVARRLLAAVAVADLAYRLFMREPVRRALGMEARHA